MSKECSACGKETKGGRIYSGLSNKYYCGDCYEKTEIREENEIELLKEACAV